ncbi:terminase [Camelimonas fluminis]|uniref:Terminase large subunit n=1 Tax=Camelimonas fluminis TaxID=1576911 RepID=A0ABV7UIG6_9HYPH|nr:terminase TerL endonuclease subunit [Camelimonas fluminis]GHE49918.1 terminase [Camelimonas fluminis]
MARPKWLFDDSPIDDPMGCGQRAVNFLRRLKHPKSRLPGQQWQLDPWVERLVRRIYSPRDADGQRQVRTVFAMLPRGSRKTSIGAALICLHTFGPERVPNGQVVSAAADAKQALIAYDEALGIIQTMPDVASKLQIRVGTHKIRHPRKGATYESISSDGATQHGRTVNFLLSDEVHSWKKRDLWEALKTSLAKTSESLHIITTTAGRGQENLAYDLVSYARKVASGEIDDPSFLPVLFEPDAGADWRDEAVWHDVNPGLTLGYPDIKGLRAMAREAENRPADRDAFRQYHLNFWPDHATSPFVDMATYDKGSDAIDMDALAGREAWLGVDLSSSGDLTVIIAAFRDGDGFVVVPHFFCPAQNLRARQDASGAPYVRWAADGLITATPGNVVDFRAVEARIRELCELYDVQEIAFDPALARNVLNNLTDDGFPAIEFRQGALSMMPAIAELERSIIAGRLRHGVHPILRFCVANCEVETNSHGHKVRLRKSKRWLSIDGAVAACMAVYRASLGESAGEGSVYDDDGWRDALASFG